MAIYFFKDFTYSFFREGEGREKERERNINVWLLLAHPQPGTWPAIQAWALTRNRTSDPSICRPVLNPLSHTIQGSLFYFLFIEFRERERNINLFFTLFMHSLVDSFKILFILFLERGEGREKETPM